MYEQRDEGVFWLATDREAGVPKLTKNGDKYYTGFVVIKGEKFPATMFFTPQEKKKNPRQPDFKIMFREPQMQGVAQAPTQQIDTASIPF